MGCGGSKLDPTQDDIPARFKPILQRRLEEIRAKRCIKNSNGISKKELLGDEANNPHESNNDEHEEELQTHEEIITSTPNPPFHVTQDCPPTLQKISDSEIAPLNRVQSLERCGTDKVADDKQVFRKRHASEGSLNIVEEEIDSDEYGYLGSGSPSFRVYCTNFPVEDDLIDEQVDEVDDEVTVEGQRYSISQESSCSNEVSVKHIPTKKGKRGRKFRITMPKGGKIYKNMQSFHIFPCSAQTNTHLLQEAAA